MRCPRCGSVYVTSQAVSQTTSKGKVKGFGCIKAFFGWLFFSIPGLLCGLCGMGKEKTRTKTTTHIMYICQGCGHRF